jgi:transmembrane sensor
MDNDDIKLLLTRYITGQLTDTERQEVKYWIGLHPENELYFIELYEAWQNMLYLKPEAINEEKAHQLFLNKISPEKKSVKPVRWLRVAAVFFCLILSSLLIIMYHYSTNDRNKHQVMTRNGSVKKVLLSDGTIVWLNAGSTLKYDADFGKTNRTVYLEGEAFFDIGHNNKTVPFLVITQNYTIRDIGTKFNLKAYPGDPFFETTVVKGEVAIEGNFDSGQHDVNRIYVKPQQVLKVYYHPEKDDHNEKQLIASAPRAYNEVQVSQIDSAKIEVYDGWKDNLLVFDGSTLGEIARVLERRYDVKIGIDSRELQNIRYSGSFKNVPDIDKVLHIIKQNTPISYTVEGQKVTITKIN